MTGNGERPIQRPDEGQGLPDDPSERLRLLEEMRSHVQQFAANARSLRQRYGVSKGELIADINARIALPHLGALSPHLAKLAEDIRGLPAPSRSRATVERTHSKTETLEEARARIAKLSIEEWVIELLERTPDAGEKVAIGHIGNLARQKPYSEAQATRMHPKLYDWLKRNIEPYGEQKGLETVGQLAEALRKSPPTSATKEPWVWLGSQGSFSVRRAADILRSYGMLKEDK